MPQTNEQPRWLKHFLKSKQSYISPIRLQDDYADELFSFYATLNPPNSNFIGLFPIADEEQTSFVSCNEDGSGLFFDVGQSVILKSAFAALLSADPQSNIFKLFKAAASLHVSKSDGFFAEKLGDAWAGPVFDGSMVKPGLISAAAGTIQSYIDIDTLVRFSDIVDASIIAHEMYHYRHAFDHKRSEIEQWVDENFDEIASFARDDESLSKPKSLIKTLFSRYRREKESKYKFATKERDLVCEEITCDLYSLIESWTLVRDRPFFCHDTPIKEFEKFFVFYNMLFCLHMSHLSFLDRAKFRMDNDLSTDLPGNLSYYNIRRIAVSLYSASLYSVAATEHKNEHTKSCAIRSFEHMARILGNVYVELSHHIMIPIIHRLNNCLMLIEQEFPRSNRADPIPISDPKDRLVVSTLPLTLDSATVATMFSPWGDNSSINWFIMSEREAFDRCLQFWGP